jgi:high-affinity Fe2+/Pb2+ permease
MKHAASWIVAMLVIGFAVYLGILIAAIAVANQNGRCFVAIDFTAEHATSGAHRHSRVSYAHTHVHLALYI